MRIIGHSRAVLDSAETLEFKKAIVGIQQRFSNYELELIAKTSQIAELTEDRDNWKQIAEQREQAIIELEEEREMLLSTIERGLGVSAADNVNNPTHYTVGGIETIDFIRAKLTPEEFVGYCKGNVLKYVSRATHKGGEEDLRKAGVYLGWATEECR